MKGIKTVKPRRFTFKKLIPLWLTACLLSPLIGEAATPTLTTLQIAQRTLSAMPQCLHYKVIGLCFWEVCTGPFCTINTTLKVDHYLPDAVVSVYRKENTNPWDYANKMIDPLAKQIGQQELKDRLGFNMGFGDEGAGSNTSEDTHFKEADLIGNPAITFFQDEPHVFLPSPAISFNPYYLSQADSYLWRSPLFESVLYPEYLIPGVHIVGTLIDNWGSVYPRTGFLNQPADTKSAAVIAQRTASIATQAGQPHLYQPLTSDSCGEQCEIFPAEENSPNTQWQMVYPLVDTTCSAFGENDLTQTQPWGTQASLQGDGNYTWILWRHYKGCIPGDGQYIGSIDWN